MKKIEIEATYSPKFTLNSEDWKLWGINLLKFTAPILVVFFSLLSQGVPVSKAYPVAILAAYGALADLFKKYTTTNIRVDE